MSEDRRTHEALSLRAFFDDLIHHLQQLVGNLNDSFHNGEQQTEEDRRIIENFVDASNNQMRAVHNYSFKLRKHVQALYKHVLLIAEEIPPPVNLNRNTFSTDPLINTLFVLSKDIDRLFNSDPYVNAYLRSHAKDQAPVLYALLTVSKTEKQTLGVGMLGDMVIHDVSQQAVNFSSHQIHAPCATRAELSAALKNYLFDRVVAQLKQEMTLYKIDQLFKTADTLYESRVKSLANPDVYLNTLIQHLKVPANLLTIDKTHFRLSKQGIKLNSVDTQSANEFDIHELIWNNRTRDVVLQIAYTR